MKLSVVIPVYNSEKILPTLVNKISSSLDRLCKKDLYEIILINDCSEDNSWKVLKELFKNNNNLKCFSLMNNVGQHNSIMAGLKLSKGEIVVTMDDDLQHSPDSIEKLLDGLNNGFDVCYSKFEKQKHDLWKKIGSWFNDKMANILYKKSSKVYLSSFKALKRNIVNEIIKFEGPYVYIDGLILNSTRNICTVNVEHFNRLSGKSNYTLKKSIGLWLIMATSFSTTPLRMVTLFGILTMFLCFITIGWILVNKINNPGMETGWASLSILILFLGSLQFIAIGIIGEYVGRINIKVNQKPQFVIKDSVEK
tara:strand:+ start:625 stop:1551 length:927 start_codon:yes stop_codon:yes gene_type:complete